MRIRIELNRDAVRDQLLRSEEIQSVCKELADDIALRCGPGYVADTHVGKNRVNAMVYADTYEARRDNLKNNTILKVAGI